MDKRASALLVCRQAEARKDVQSAAESRQRAQPLDIPRSEGYSRLPGLFLAGHRPFESITVRARLNNRGPVSNAIQERLA